MEKKSEMIKYFDTLAIHGGEGKKPENALNNPIFMTSTFSFDSLETAEKTFSFATDDYVYTRGNNPTLKVLEQKMALLEQGVDAVAFASGMAAISSGLFSLLKPGDELIAHRVIYGSTHNLISNLLPAYGIKTKLIDLCSTENLAKVLTPQSRVVFLETPANPSLEIIDIRKISELIARQGIKLVVDNTFATPYLQRPLELGADLVIHSATKYISGHGDVLGGIAISADQDYIDQLKFAYMCELGGVLSPFNGWLLLRGLKTLGLRMRCHQENAIKVAEFLQQHPRVKKVYYPGLSAHPGHQIARSQMDGFGAIISFELTGELTATKNLLNKLKLIKLAVSLGDTETLVEYPFAMTHRSYSPEELHTLGLTAEMVRLSIGLEDSRDLITDLEQALG